MSYVSLQDRKSPDEERSLRKILTCVFSSSLASAPISNQCALSLRVPMLIQALSQTLADEMGNLTR